jgi:hypothetical protein
MSIHLTVSTPTVIAYMVPPVFQQSLLTRNKNALRSFTLPADSVHVRSVSSSMVFILPALNIINPTAPPATPRCA